MRKWCMEFMHGILDVSKQENAHQIYHKDAAKDLAGLRYMAFSLLRTEVIKINVQMK